ncbi:MAG TPA: hypothetical protein VLC53_14720 [Myxococcota bacterium]|nr:hypothetical protein [Myxococcota bacterium]
MRPTGYDDGAACPGGCDAHVVFSDAHNGTRNAFDPASSRAAPAPCRRGADCRICFDDGEESCTVARYRGAGPGPGRFDFTPAFFAERCQDPALPARLAEHCAFLRRKTAILRARRNCFAEPEHARCRAHMEAVAARKAADELRWAECRVLGLDAYNERHAGRPELQRSVECHYERQATARGADGSRWPRLLDGGCGPGRYVGRDGLDCCSGDSAAAAVFHPECDAFFPEP